MRKVDGNQEKIKSCPTHLQYSKNVRGVDTANQLRKTYPCQTQSQKWQHQIFFFLLDNIIVDAWIIQSDVIFRLLKEPFTHFSFLLQLAKNLSAQWRNQKHGYSMFSPTFEPPMALKAWIKRRSNVRCVANEPIAHALGALDITYVDILAIGLLIGEPFLQIFPPFGSTVSSFFLCLLPFYLKEMYSYFHNLFFSSLFFLPICN